MTKKSKLNIELVNKNIVAWLKDYATNAKMNGFVVGISGGIDSAVTSTLCAQTGLEVLCVEMPIHQDPNQVSRGKKHIDDLKNRFSNVSSKLADLTPVFETFKNQVRQEVADDKQQLALANSRSRLRMTTLYYYAGIYGLLVAGTGNKVEDFGVGFFTKYGDGGVDLSPIADLMKSDVYELASYLGIDEKIQKAAPTDGLFGDERTDEQQLGATYEELEWAMLFIENNNNKEILTEREQKVLEIYKKLNTTNKHKMREIPVFRL
ncbi:NAD(+) synthase [Flavobacterium branchiophilum]|uniref:NH(3)-dependent NAD(+) synthetase n=1 Tax=Flavobacterium branchiophilum (strain FL-15) TaxID=1034807 RepID=G2Z327_FLABF|nr:NAD(+) synthase [Flavobacterium branchiophilum]CCB70369.1 NH(3)-dependent NAD(+) synthetase [Flavobacterium branchiophilum FL-15]